jgi:DNA primase
VRAYGASAFLELLKTTEPYIEYIIDMAIAAHDISKPSGKVEAINSILPHLARMRDKVARADYSDQIADRFKVDSRVIRDEMRRVATNRQQSLDPKRLRASQEVTVAERQLLELMLANEDVRRAAISNLTEEDFAELASGAIFTAIIEIERDMVELDFHNLVERVEGEDERGMLPALFMSDLEWAGGSDFDTLFKKATEAITSLRRRRLERRLEAIQIELGQAERESDSERVFRLYLEKAEIQKRRLALTIS